MRSLLVFVAVFAAVGHLAPGRAGVQASAQRHQKNNAIDKFFSHVDADRRCQEKALEIRERQADVVFSGTVRDVETFPAARGGGVGGAPDKIVSVEIKRVIKGNGVVGGKMASAASSSSAGGRLEHRIVRIVGFEDPRICNTFARVGDSRIFLVSLRNGGGGGGGPELVLNSSLVRLTLNNLEIAEAVVKGER